MRSNSNQNANSKSKLRVKLDLIKLLCRKSVSENTPITATSRLANINRYLTIREYIWVSNIYVSTQISTLPLVLRFTTKLFL